MGNPPIDPTAVYSLDALAELVRMAADAERYREALEEIAREWDGQMGTGQMLTDFVRAALEASE